MNDIAKIGIIAALCSPSVWGYTLTEKDNHVTLSGDFSTVHVDLDQWSLSISDANDELILPTMPDVASRLGFGLWIGKSFIDQYPGYWWRIGAEMTWFHATSVASHGLDDNNCGVFVADTTHPFGAQISVSICESSSSSQVIISATKPEGTVSNRLGIGFGSTSSSEGYFGFGERFNHPNQRGHVLYCWVEDGGWGLNYTDMARWPKGPTSTYVPMPWLLSSSGFGVWLNSTYRSDWDLDSPSLHDACNDDDGCWFVQVERDDVLELQVFIPPPPPSTAGKDGSSSSVKIRQILADFTTITHSRPLVPPKWTFGPWNQFSKELEKFDISMMDAMYVFLDYDIPVSVSHDSMHFFPAGAQIGQEEKLYDRNKNASSIGIKSLAYFNSMIDTSYYPAYNICSELNLFVKEQDDTDYVFIYKGAARAPFLCSVLDLTLEDARRWYWQQMDRAMALGYSGFMYDYGEYIDQLAVASDGTDGYENHNRYPLDYQRAAFDYFTTVKSKITYDDDGIAYAPDYVYFVRSGYTGTGGLVWSHWTGDPMCDWSHGRGIPAQITAMLSIGLSGVGYSGSDIGGFVWLEPPSLEMWCRWTAIGAFSAVMHVQGGGTDVLGIPKTQIHDWPDGWFIWRKFVKLRMSLFPYTYKTAKQVQTTGIPMLRHLILDYADDDVAIDQGYQFMYGDNLLVAPIVDEGVTDWSVYLPAGNWIDLTRSLIYDVSDGRHRISYTPPIESCKGVWRVISSAGDLSTIPLFVKAGSIIETMDPTLDTLVEQVDVDGIVAFNDVEMYHHLWCWPVVDDDDDDVMAANDDYEIKSVNDHSISLHVLSMFNDDDDDDVVYWQVALPYPIIDMINSETSKR